MDLAQLVWEDKFWIVAVSTTEITPGCEENTGGMPGIIKKSQLVHPGELHALILDECWCVLPAKFMIGRDGLTKVLA